MTNSFVRAVRRIWKLTHRFCFVKCQYHVSALPSNSTWKLDNKCSSEHLERKESVSTLNKKSDTEPDFYDCICGFPSLNWTLMDIKFGDLGKLKFVLSLFKWLYIRLDSGCLWEFEKFPFPTSEMLSLTEERSFLNYNLMWVYLILIIFIIINLLITSFLFYSLLY